MPSPRTRASSPPPPGTPLPSASLDRIARIAVRQLAAASAFVALEDDGALLVLGAAGLVAAPAVARAPLARAVCRAVVDAGVPLLVPDVRADARFRGHPPLPALEAGAWVGVPITLAGDVAPGALVVAAAEPRRWSATDVETLADLAALAGGAIDAGVDPTGRERTLAPLESRGERLLALFAVAPAFICILRGPEFVIEFANERFQQLIGHRDVLGRPADDVVPEFRQQGFRALAERVLATGEPHLGHRASVMLARTPGAPPELRVVNFVFQPIVADDGAISGVITLGVDVTDEVRASAQLARREALLRETERLAAIGSWEQDVVSGEIRWTDEMYRLHGHVPGTEPLTFDSYVALVHPDDRARLGAALARFAETGDPWTMDYRVVRPDGSFRCLQVRARGDRDAQGHPVRIHGSCQDVSERVRALAALRENEERLRLVQRATNDLIWDYDVVTRRMEVGEDVPAALGYVAAQTESTLDWWQELLHPDDYARVLASMHGAIERGDDSWHEEFRVRRGDGRYMHAIDRAHMLRDADGQVVRMIGALQDVTEQRMLEAQLQQAHRMEAVGRLAGGIAHDFNNLLAVIAASTAMARDEVPPGSPALLELDEIAQAERRAAELTRQLLVLSRGQVLHPQRVDLGRQVTAMERLLRRITGADVRLETRVEPGLWPVHADPGQLDRVLLNLATNARDAMPDGGTLRVTATNRHVDAAAARQRPGLPPGAYVALVVEDTGVGIPADVLPQIFEPFVTTKEPGKGTGLGLSIVYGTVKQSGGYVYVDSEPGRGATFTVLLPRHENAPPPADRP